MVLIIRSVSGLLIIKVNRQAANKLYTGLHQTHDETRRTLVAPIFLVEASLSAFTHRIISSKLSRTPLPYLVKFGMSRRVPYAEEVAALTA